MSIFHYKYNLEKFNVYYKLHCHKKQNIIPLKPPIYNGQVNSDMEEFSRRVHIFQENNLYNDKILIIDINFFTKHESKDDLETLQAILSDNKHKNSSFWYKRFSSNNRKKYLSTILDRVLKKLENIKHPNGEQLTIQHMIPATTTKEELLNLLFKMCIFTFSIVDIRKDPKYTTLLNIHTIPVFKVFVRNKMFSNNNYISSSICEIKGILTEKNIDTIFDTIMENIILYILEVHIANRVRNNQYELFVQEVNNAYNVKYDAKNANNRFSEIF